MDWRFQQQRQNELNLTELCQQINDDIAVFVASTSRSYLTITYQ